MTDDQLPIFDLLINEPGGSWGAKQIAERLKLGPNGDDVVRQKIRRMKAAGAPIETKRGVGYHVLLPQ